MGCLFCFYLFCLFACLFVFLVFVLVLLFLRVFCVLDVAFTWVLLPFALLLGFDVVFFYFGFAVYTCWSTRTSIK